MTLPPPTPAAVRAAAQFDPDFPEPGRLRQVLGIGQAEMAEMARVGSYRTYQDWEHGKSRTPLSAWELMLVKTDMHPVLAVSPRSRA